MGETAKETGLSGGEKPWDRVLQKGNNGGRALKEPIGLLPGKL